MSADGTRVAIGAPYNDGCRDRRWARARVRGDISGTLGPKLARTSTARLRATDPVGQYRCPRTARAAIGAPYNDGAGTTTAGHVRVCGERRGRGLKIGADIDGEAAYRLPGDIGIDVHGRHARACAWVGLLAAAPDMCACTSESGGTWTMVADTIDGEAPGDRSGTSVSMSSDRARGDRRITAMMRRHSRRHVRVFQFGVPCSPPAVPMHAGEVVGGLGECGGIEKIPHLSTCTIACNGRRDITSKGPAMCNQGTLDSGVKCLCEGAPTTLARRSSMPETNEGYTSRAPFTTSFGGGLKT